jgi:hypothetical protein
MEFKGNVNDRAAARTFATKHLPKNYARMAAKEAEESSMAKKSSSKAPKMSGSMKRMHKGCK